MNGNGKKDGESGGGNGSSGDDKEETLKDHLTHEFYQDPAAYKDRWGIPEPEEGGGSPEEGNGGPGNDGPKLN